MEKRQRQKKYKESSLKSKFLKNKSKDRDDNFLKMFPPVRPRELLSENGWLSMLATIRDVAWNTLNMQDTYAPIRKDGIIHTSLVVTIKRLKDPPRWLKVATH